VGVNVWLCDPRVNLDDLEEAIQGDAEQSPGFPKDDFDTLGGFVFDLFGKIPAKFEKVTWNDFDFIIQEMDGHKVVLIKVIRQEHGEKTV
jgi:CBS domain containing-hemolysin-like protein